MNAFTQEEMIRIEQTDESKETITYLKAYNLASNFIRKATKQLTLQELQKEFKERGLAIPTNILSQVKNKSLPHYYPDTIRKILEFFGYTNIIITKKILLTFDKPDKVTEGFSSSVSDSSNQKVSSSKSHGKGKQSSTPSKRGRKPKKKQ
jgi:hypothetical protein